MSYVTNPDPPDRTRFRKRFIFPLTVLAVCGGIFAIPRIWIALGNDTDAALPLVMTTQMALPLAVFLIAAWWLFFSGFRWLTRFIVLAMVLALASLGWMFGIRKVELRTTPIGLVPVLHFRWTSTPMQQFEAFQKQQPATSDDLAAIDLTIGPEDFPSYRGPKRDGVITFLRLQTDWEKHPPKMVWQHPCVGGYSGIAVAGNIAVTMEQRDEQEVVVCYDRATGRQRWTYAYDAYHKDVMGDGPRSTPTIHDGHIYSIGATGALVCLNAEGKKQWSINLFNESKAKNITWGLTGSPLIVDDLVIAHAGVDPAAPAGAALVAFKQKTGTKRWAVGNRKAGYSSPQLAILAKTPQILLFDADGLISYDPKTGKELWQTPWVTKMDMNMIQPVVVGDDQVFISSEATNGCALLRVTAPGQDAPTWRVATVWQNKNLGARFANPVTDGKHIFGLHNITGVLRCLDVTDGRIKWTGDRYGPGQMLLVDDVLLVASDEGEVSLLKTDASAADVLARFQVLDGKTWNTPALAGDQLFVRNQSAIACVRLPRR